MLNGSPREFGCTFTALSEVASTLNQAGVETDILHVGVDPIQSCRACRGCAGKSRCVVQDGVNVALERMETCDGLVVGSPVHFSSASGAITCFLDRLFYAGGAVMAYKPGAAVASCRRAGTLTALDQLNKYFVYAHMPLVPSQYWCMVYGNTPDEVRSDLEGMQTMRVLGRNMAWMLKSFAAARAAGITPPGQVEERARTNFIR